MCFPTTASRHWLPWRMPLTAGTLALLMSVNSAAQPTAPATAPVAAPDATVSDTRLGLENLQLLQKGITPGGQGAALTPEQLISTPEILKVDPTPEVPEADSDESTLRELRRRQWSEENWLVDGMRRSELAADEADLAEDNLAAQSGGARSAEDTSARARVEAGTSNEWLALAVETQRETESGAGHADAPDAREDAAGKRPDSKSVAEKANPLGDFMAGWLSGESRVLLSSTSERPGGAIGLRPDTVLESDRNDEPTPAARGSFASRVSGPAGGSPGADAATSNPFLAFQDVDDGAGRQAFDAVFTPPGPDLANAPQVRPQENLLPLASEPTTGSPTLAPPDKPDEKPSEPWRPPVNDNEKYFPRLKRF